MTVVIRTEHPDDYKLIEAINNSAFKEEGPARIVDSIRTNENLIIGLVATENKQLVGHIAFSKIKMESSQIVHTILSLRVDIPTSIDVARTSYRASRISHAN